MSTKSISYVREDSPKAQRPEITDAPIEIKIPQRMVNLPVVPANILRNIGFLVLSVITIVAGGLFYTFLHQ